jgi:hypothetical protein
LEQIYPLPDGLNLTPVMSTRALHEGMQVAEVPIPYSERVGRSKLSVVRDGSVFLHSMVWTVLAYNPVRILGTAGLLGILFGLLAGAGLVVARLQGQTSLSPLELAVLFGGMVAGVIGISVFSLGVTFNYLVSLFYRRPVRQGLFGRPLFQKPLERHFWWLGAAALLVATVAGAGSLLLSLNGWEIGRLWLYLSASAMLALVAVQLLIFWLLARILDELSQRALATERDLHGAETITSGAGQL